MFQFVDQKIQATLILKKKFKQILFKNGVTNIPKYDGNFSIYKFKKNGFYFLINLDHNNERKTIQFFAYIENGIFDCDFDPFFDTIDLDEESLDELKFMAEEYLRKFGPKKKDRQINLIF